METVNILPRCDQSSLCVKHEAHVEAPFAEDRMYGQRDSSGDFSR